MDDLISRQQAIDAVNILCEEHRYKIPGKSETYSQYAEAWQDALSRTEGEISRLPSAQPEEVSDQWTRIEYPVGINTIRTYLKHERCGLMGRESGMMYLNHEHGWIPYLYCPNCGMRMKGVKDEQLHNG